VEYETDPFSREATPVRDERPAAEEFTLAPLSRVQSDYVRRNRERWLLEQIREERYRAVLERLFDGTRGANLAIGDSMKAGISLRSPEVGSSLLFSVAYLSAPGVDGFRRTHDLSLGYRRDDWYRTPDRRNALEAYCASAARLRGARRIYKDFFVGIELSPRDVSTQVEEIVRLLCQLASESQSPIAA
jgi:hypothetical protein